MQDDTSNKSDSPAVILSTRHIGGGISLAGSLETYWRELRGARMIPRRTSVDPTRIDAALPWSFVVERVAPTVGRLRVAGQKINAFVGMEARGMPMSVLFSAQGRRMLDAYFPRVFDDPAIVELPLRSKRTLTAGRLDGLLLMLPLAADDGTVTRALCAMFVDGAIGRSPRSFDILDNANHRCEQVICRPTLVAVGQTHDAGEQKGPTLVRPALKLVVSNP